MVEHLPLDNGFDHACMCVVAQYDVEFFVTHFTVLIEQANTVVPELFLVPVLGSMNPHSITGSITYFFLLAFFEMTNSYNNIFTTLLSESLESLRALVYKLKTR